MPLDAAWMTAEGPSWGVGEQLLAEIVNQLRQANWLTQIVNTAKQGDRKKVAASPPEMVRPPGPKTAPGPRRKPRRGAPMGRAAIEAAGGGWKEDGDG